jgi:signal peptidase I
MNCQQDSSNKLAGRLAEDVVRTFGEVRLRAFGTSMAPAILPGDLISIQRAGLRDISPGEVVLFSQDNRLFIHRVVSQSVISMRNYPGEPCLITRGDRLGHDDPPVISSELLGRVISIQRGNRQAKPVAQPGRLNRLMTRLLRSSDRTTYLYIRLAAWLRSFTTGRASCRA